MKEYTLIEIAEITALAYAGLLAAAFGWILLRITWPNRDDHRHLRERERKLRKDIEDWTGYRTDEFKKMLDEERELYYRIPDPWPELPSLPDEFLGISRVPRARWGFPYFRLGAACSVLRRPVRPCLPCHRSVFWVWERVRSAVRLYQPLVGYWVLGGSRVPALDNGMDCCCVDSFDLAGQDLASDKSVWGRGESNARYGLRVRGGRHGRGINLNPLSPHASV